MNGYGKWFYWKNEGREEGLWLTSFAEMSDLANGRIASRAKRAHIDNQPYVTILNAELSVMNAEMSVMNAELSVMNAEISVMNAEMSVTNAEMSVMDAESEVFKDNLEVTKDTCNKCIYFLLLYQFDFVYFCLRV